MAKQYTSDEYIHEKVFNITCHQENEDYNHNGNTIMQSPK